MDRQRSNIEAKQLIVPIFIVIILVISAIVFLQNRKPTSPLPLKPQLRVIFAEKLKKLETQVTKKPSPSVTPKPTAIPKEVPTDTPAPPSPTTAVTAEPTPTTTPTP